LVGNAGAIEGIFPLIEGPEYVQGLTPQGDCMNLGVTVGENAESVEVV